MGTRENPAARPDSATALANPVPQHPAFFNFDAQAVRVVGTWDQPWFVAKDVCDVLEIGKHRDALLSLDDYEKGRPVVVDTLGGPQEMATVSEAGLYSLIFRSRKPQAKLFRRWVTETVLPQIRKTGRFEAVPREQLVFPDAPPPPPGYSVLAMLRTKAGIPVPDLSTEHTARLLNAAIGDVAGEWAGSIGDLAALAKREKLFFWVIRDEHATLQRSHLGCVLHRRLGIVYGGIGQTHLTLRAIGHGRGRQYAIIRSEGSLA